MRMIDEDEVGLKEKPEDTRYIKHITSKYNPKHREYGQRTSNFAIIVIADPERGRVVTPSRVLGGGEIHSQAHHLPRDCCL